MRKKSLYIVIMAASLLALAASLYARFSVEHVSKTVDMLLDYNETKMLAEQSGKSMDHWLKLFEGWGANSVAIEEESFKSLIDIDKRPLKLRTMESVMGDYELVNQLPTDLKKMVESGKSDEYDLLVSTPSKPDFDFIKRGLESRYDSAFYKLYEQNGLYYILLDGTENDALYAEIPPVFDSTKQAKQRPAELVGSKLQDIGIGFDAKKIEEVKASGLKVLPRPKNYDANSAKLIDAYFADIKKYDMKPDYIVFSGSSVVGYDSKVNPKGIRKPDTTTIMTSYYNDSNMGNLQVLIDKLVAEKITVGMVETGVQRQYVEQDGIDVVADRLHYEAVRVFPVVKYIQQRFKFYNYTGAEEIENTIYRAVTERNIRSVYFRPFLLNETKYVTDEIEYEKMFKGLEKRLQPHGINFAAHGQTADKQKASIYKFNAPKRLTLALMAAGIMAAGVLFLRMMLPLPEMLEIIMLLGGAASVFPVALVKPGIITTLFPMLAAVVFPSLAIVVFMEYARERIASNSVQKLGRVLTEGTMMLVACVAISMLGGLYIGGILSHSKYIIEMEIFRGVKPSQILPMGVFLVVYLIKFGFKRNREEMLETRHFYSDVLRILDENIKVIYIIAAGIFGAAAIVFIARTGHETSIQPSDAEMIFRNLLENNLLARPRTKEFLMAFPALMVLVQFANRGLRKWILPLGLIVTVGLASVANTYCHLRTAIMLSVIRTTSGLVIGIMLGVVAVWVLHGVLNLLNSIKGRKINE